MNFDFWRSREKELDDELQFHVRMATQDRMDRGESQAEALASARRELGNAGLIKEVTRQAWGWSSLEELVQDLRFGARILRKNAGATLVSVLTLALGIGASTAIFSVVYEVLLRSLPYDKAEQIVRVWEADGKGERMRMADPNFDDLRAQNHSLQGIAEFSSSTDSVSGGSEPRRLTVAFVSRDFFPVMRVHVVRGRDFAADDHHAGAAPVALVSYSYWRQYLNSTDDLSASKLTIENRVMPVIGVLPSGFHFPDDTDVWMPREIETWLPSRSAHNWNAIGRLREGMPLQQAETDLATIGRRLKQQYPEDNEMQGAAVEPLKADLTSDVRPALLILLGAVSCLLLVACANVMNLLLAQASARQGELAVRSALGASRGRLIRQFLAETLLLALTGGAAGVIAAYFGVQALVRIAPPNTPRIANVAINLPVLFFALGLSVMVAVALGVFTAWRATSGDVQSALAEGSRSQSNTPGRQRLGRMIIAGQLAVTLLLLVGAGLLGRSLLRVLSVDPGFRTEHIVTMDLAFPPAYGPAKTRRVQFLDTLFDRLRALPGVSEAGGTSTLPLGNDGISDGGFVELSSEQLSPKNKNLIERSGDLDLHKADPKDLKELVIFFEDLFQDKDHIGHANYAVASEGYLRALGIPLLRGRLFEAHDTADAPHVALISESLAREKWPGQEPMGRTIEYGNMDGDLRLLTVVGVVGDIRDKKLESSPEPTVYVNYRQRPQHTYEFSVVMRTAADPAATLDGARRILNELDPSIPPRLNTFTRVFAASLNTRRFNLVLIGIFAVSALLLAVAGIYGVLAYSVSRRTREIGVRIALGASAAKVRGLVLRQAMLTALVGVAVGLVASAALTRFIRSLLFEISSMDALTYCGVAMVLLLVAALAAYLPARRATQVDPIVALRHE